MKNPDKIEILAYNPHWPDFFAQEASRITKALGGHLREIYHFGSTAIPDMPAKPVIDMMLVCDNVDEIDLIAEKLQELHYYNLRRQIIPHQSFFVRRQDNNISFHLHLHERGSPQIKRHINFRDYVIQHPEDAKAYATLKINLATKFADDRYQYVLGKDKLVQEIDSKAKCWPQRRHDYLKENTGIAAQNWSNEKLLKAMTANFNVYMTQCAQYLNQVELIRVPGFTIVNTGLHNSSLNAVLDADFTPAEADRKILEITRYFTEKNLPFSWWISPFDQPDNLAEQLEHHGYQNTRNHSAMYFDLDSWDAHLPSISPLEIIKAQDAKTLHDFAFVLGPDDSFKKYFSWIASILTDDDPIEYYVGYVDGKAVACGSSCYAAQVAGLYWLASGDNQRGKDYCAALQRYCLKRAKERGYHIAVLHASDEGYFLWEELGWRECGEFGEFELEGLI